MIPSVIRTSSTANAGPDYWWIVGCPCRSDGPWKVVAPPTDSYYCARCGQPMSRVLLAVADEDGHTVPDFVWTLGLFLLLLVMLWSLGVRF